MKEARHPTDNKLNCSEIKRDASDKAIWMWNLVKVVGSSMINIPIAFLLDMLANFGDW